MKITDILLQQSAPAARNIWLDTLTKSAPVPEHTFSHEFEQVMRELDGTIQYQKLSPLSV